MVGDALVGVIHKKPKEGGISVPKIGLMGGGVALVAGGAVTYMVLYRPNYLQFQYFDEFPDELSSGDAELIESRHDTYRFLTFGLWGAGALLAVTGAVIPLGSTDLQLVPVGNGVLLQGRF
jgi:hypothetical protein